MTNEVANEDVDFASLLDALAPHAHGCQGLDAVKIKLCGIKKTHFRIELLKDLIVTQPIRWEDVRKRVWSTLEEAERNKFPFLQGDLIDTRSVAQSGKARSGNNLETWIVLSTTCHITQQKEHSKWIRVAPAYPVKRSYRKSDNVSETERYRHLQLASELKLHRGFPYPNVDDEDDFELLGYFCDIDDISLIKRDEIGFATPLASLNVRGWHLLNAVMQRFDTQADLKQETSIRQSSNNVIPIREG